MADPSTAEFLATCGRRITAGPVALVFVEDEVEIASTLRHHAALGFRTIVAFMPDAFPLPPDAPEAVIRVRHGVRDPAFHEIVTAVSDRLPPKTWVYYCFNAEYLFFPFCETRSVGDLLRFHAEERRRAMLTYVVDLYATDFDRFPNAVARDEAWFDRIGYYALARHGPDGTPRERQLDFFGGLRWRFEEHVPPERRRIDRISLFRTKPGLLLAADHRLSEEELNTYACPWHNNLTAAIASFRTAKALKSNPGSTYDIATFHWHNSVRFDWTSQQLMDLGLMEPGQWF